MSLFSYDASVSPDPATISAAVSASGDSLVALVSPPTFTVSLKPSGNPVTWILLTILSPLAGVIASVVPTLIKDQVTLNLGTVPLAQIKPVTVSLTSTDSVTITPGNLSLTGGGGYATLTGTVTVS
jgi:hypothetical protein